MIGRLVIFGATGDLSGRYLLPGLAALAAAGRLPSGFQLIGAGREDWTDQDFRSWARERLSRHGGGLPTDATEVVVASSRYARADVTDAAEIGHVLAGGGPLAAYLALPPALFPAVVSALHCAGLPDPPTRTSRESTPPWEPRPSPRSSWSWRAGAGPAPPSGCVPASAEQGPSRGGRALSPRPAPAAEAADPAPNVLRFGLDPETLTLELTGTGPGPSLRLAPLTFRAQLPPAVVPAYGRLLLDVLNDDPTLSIRGDEAEESWRIVDLVVAAWSRDLVPLEEYPAGSEGLPRRSEAPQRR
jgi:glucose-6-phosphate 1-dehydrogenase